MENYIESILKHKLPRWGELPDFELYMDQVISLMQKYLAPYILSEDAITPSMINNYVKMEVLPAPKKKRYNKEHLARLIIICLMKKQLAIPTIDAIIKGHTIMGGIESFFDEFAENYENSMKASVERIKSEELLANAFLLAINSSASHGVAEKAFKQLFPEKNDAEKPKKEKKEKNKK